MKKSKFLQNSKDMLSRSFNPAKCKTSLRLAGSRLKLLRNKKEVQVKQMKREIAQLLESGQDRTARIRVEHVIREEKMMAAYDLLEIYCELIVARLPIIESQKNCPIDLKEAIASVVFAAPRCGDVPELLDVRKHFTAKYGKDFTTAAIELRPQCGVGRMLVEKLSATAPDGQTKIKILSAIAEEHNVKWDLNSFEEKDSIPPNDLLSGPSSFGKESELYAEPPHFEAAQVQAPPSNNNMHSSPLNFSQQDARTSVRAEKLVSAQTSGVSTTFQPEARPPALGNGRAQGDSNTSPRDRHRWNMEFKDATSAAQAAAESAERASIAARAAAELSSHGRILRQYSTESRMSDVDILKDEGPETHLNSNFSCKIFSEASVDRSSSERTRLQNEQIDGIKPNDLKTATKFEEDGGGGGSQEFSQSASLKSKASADDDYLDHGVPVVDEYSRKNSFKEVSEDEMSMKKQSFSETANDWPEKAESLREERIGKQHSVSSSCSQSSISDDVNVFSNSEYQKFENDAGKDPFVGIGKRDIYGEAPQTSSHESAAVVFDKSDSDIDDHGFDKGPTYDEQDLEFHLSSLGQKSPERLSINTDSWSPRSSSSKIVKSTPPLFFTREKSSPDFSENMTLRDDSELDNYAPVTFDDSDGPTSESDEDMNTRHNKVDDSRDLLHKQNESGQSVGSQFRDKTRQSVGSPFKDEEYSVFDSKTLSHSSDDELNSSEEMHWERNRVNIFDADSPEKLSLVKPSAEQPPLGPKESQMESKKIGNEFSPESGERLNFEKLTGGFRHKGHNHLPFLKNRLDVSSSVKKEAETTATITRSTTPPPPVERPEIGTMLDHKKSPRTPDLHYESDSDSSEEEKSLQKSSGHKQALSAVKEVKTKSSLGVSNSIFGSDSSDLDEDSPKESLTRKSHLRSGISRRTKALPSSSGMNSYSKMRLKSEALDSDAGMDRKPTTSYNSETPKKSESPRRNSDKWENYEQPISAGVASMPAKSNFWGPPEQPNSGKATSVNKESKIWVRSEAHDSDANLGRKPSTSYSPVTQQQESQSLRRNSSQLGNSEQPTPAKVASKPPKSSLWGTPEKSNSGKATSTTMQESKISQKSPAVEEPSSPQQKSEVPIGNENPNTASNKTSSNKDDGTKKASHVHPKLPDYDALIQSLRMNRS
ncbi:hypothetical protein Pfo_000337 [Paulownia fortunei]|nr:hypothetical protein Pfo_000337 [Paulownia fortunei]